MPQEKVVLQRDPYYGIDTDTFPDERHYRFDDIHLEKTDIRQFL